jgi:hypothetical protein
LVSLTTILQLMVCEKPIEKHAPNLLPSTASPIYSISKRIDIRGRPEASRGLVTCSLTAMKSLFSLVAIVAALFALERAFIRAET